MDNDRAAAWKPAIALLMDWERNRGHLDELLELQDPGSSRWLVREVFRNWLTVERVVRDRLRRSPRPVTLNILRLAVAECLARERPSAGRIVHHAVETARAMGLSESECRFVNAVLRGILREEALPLGVGLQETHPRWLVERWAKQFGEKDTAKLLEWNQGIPRLTVAADGCPRYAQETRWNGYYRVNDGCLTEAIKDLRSGNVYAQDPFARIPVALLGLREGETVLDLCAAPGGKTKLLAKAVGDAGRVVALDRPGRRVERLMENSRRWRNVRVCGRRLQDFTENKLRELTGGATPEAVLIDVPCSNTGVIQKRPDVKLRLRPDDFKSLAAAQLELLQLAAAFVVPGGRLVYSTCSIERAENRDVVDAFLDASPDWKLVRSVMSYPWRCEHDGGGAFLLTNGLTE